MESRVGAEVGGAPRGDAGAAAKVTLLSFLYTFKTYVLSLLKCGCRGKEKTYLSGAFCL